MPPLPPHTIPLPCMTVDLGTATTYNVISAQRAFLGGFIVPGVQTSLRAISAGTAQLPPHCTRAARASDWCQHGGRTEQRGHSLARPPSWTDWLIESRRSLASLLTVVATGGLAPYIMPCCKRKVIYDADLLFKGAGADLGEKK